MKETDSHASRHRYDAPTSCYVTEQRDKLGQLDSRHGPDSHRQRSKGLAQGRPDGDSRTALQGTQTAAQWQAWPRPTYLCSSDSGCPYLRMPTYGCLPTDAYGDVVQRPNTPVVTQGDPAIW